MTGLGLGDQSWHDTHVITSYDIILFVQLLSLCQEGLFQYEPVHFRGLVAACDI